MRRSIGTILAASTLILGGGALGVGILNIPEASAAVTFVVNDASNVGLADLSGTTCASSDFVPPGDEEPTCTLRAAVEAADNLGSDDPVTVTLPASAGLINGTADYELDGQLSITNTTITINGAGAADSILNAQESDRIFNIDNNSTATISGVTITHGDPEGGSGGGIQNAGNLTLTNSTVSNSEAQTGGGIYQDDSGENAPSTTLTGDTITDNTAYEGDGGGIKTQGDDDPPSLTLTNSTVSNNSAERHGGGIALDDIVTFTMTDSTLSDNTANSSDESSGRGGGLDSEDDSDITISGSLIADNTAYNGGGIGIFFYNSFSMSSSEITDNTATEGGGGVYDDNEGLPAMAISSTTIDGNSADGTEGGSGIEGDGGGILSNGCSPVTLTNDTISDNSASKFGGGTDTENCSGEELVKPGAKHSQVAHDDLNTGQQTYTFDTFDGNTSADTGGEDVVGGGNINQDDDAPIVLADTIVSGAGTGEGTAPECRQGAGGISSLGYNLISDDTCGTADPTDQIGSSPELGSLGDNGGPAVGNPVDDSTVPTQTELPDATSPADGAVPNGTCTASGVTTDERGEPRPPSSGAACTIGAVEIAAAVTPPPTFNPNGYRLAAMDGGVFDFGIEFGGSLANLHLNAPIVGLANEPGPFGYLMVASDGGVFSFSGAQYFGSLGGKVLASPIAGIATTPDGGGYWLVSRTGQTFNFGDAPAIGSATSAKPIVGIATTPDGQGAWLVSSDGGVFALGDAIFEGSMGGKHLNAPIVGIAPSNDGLGYLLVASDGGVFTFGDAVFHGSTGSLHLNAPMIGIAETNDNGGYWLVATDGGVFAFGDAPFLGSMGGIKLNAPIVGIQHLGFGPQSG